MPNVRRISLALGATGILLIALVQASWAGESSTVTVRVEGLNGETLLPQKEVSTTAAPIPVESGSCSGTSAGGALFDAVEGRWKVLNEPEGIEIDGIEGLNFPRLKAQPGVYWAFWLNNSYASKGACAEEVSTGADLVFVPQCYAINPFCASASAPGHFLTLSRPRSAAINVGECLALTVASINTGTGEPDVTLPAGVTVTAGAFSVSPEAGKVATLKFTSAGIFTLQARGPDAVPSDTYTIQVESGHEGSCGGQSAGSNASTVLTPKTSTENTTASSVAGVSSPYKGPFAVVASVSGITEHAVFSAATAPRVLSGAVDSHTAITSVRLDLRRSYRGQCWDYNGTSERFVRARCGAAATPFTVSRSSTFSYLLPHRLPRGRYVLDVLATDIAGNQTSLARGSTRTVFYVR